MKHIPIPAEPSLDPTHFPLIKECGERMIPLSTLSDKITVYPAYFHEGYEGATTEAYLREGAAQRLLQAAKKLPEGYTFVVLDGWRSFQVQQSLYDRFKQSLLEQGWREGEELTRELTKFVAKPSQDVNRPSPHLTGGAVDLTISGPDGWLEMGTVFDDFSEKATTRYFDLLPDPDEHDLLVRNNRRMLYQLMIEAGFINYSGEWWHYEFGTLRWARKNQTNAIYQGVIIFDKKSS